METKSKNFSVVALRLSDDDLRKLDGSVKKNTAFQRKLVSDLVMVDASMMVFDNCASSLILGQEP